MTQAKAKMKINRSVLVQWTQGSFSFKWFTANCTCSLLEGDLSTYSSSIGDGCIHLGLINGHELTNIHSRVSVPHNTCPWDRDRNVTEVQTFEGFPEKQTLLPLLNILIAALFSSSLLCSNTADVWQKDWKCYSSLVILCKQQGPFARSRLKPFNWLRTHVWMCLISKIFDENSAFQKDLPRVLIESSQLLS